MSPDHSCESVRKLAPEIALGIASGEARAQALAHIATCPDCRRLLSELSATADEILLLAPQRGPSLGFENKVLAAIGSRRPRMGRLLLAAAAVLIAAIIGGGGVFWATNEDRELAGSIRSALAEANGKYFSVLPLRDESGRKIANVFAYEGEPSWVFVVWQEPLVTDDYEVEARLLNGQTLSLGGFDSDGTRRTWGGDLPGSLHDLHALSVLAHDGGDDYTATFHRGG